MDEAFAHLIGIGPSGRIGTSDRARRTWDSTKDMTVTDRTAETTNTSTSQIAGTAIWIALIAGLTVIGSFAFACAAPLAAVAALAALKMGRNEGLALVVTAWLVNQAVGFLLLSYPHTADSYAWGAAIGVSAVLGFLAARVATRPAMPRLLSLTAAFAAAFVAYQIGLYLAGVTFAYEGDAFSMAIVTEVLVINSVAYVAFVLVHRAAIAMELVRPATPATAAATA